MILYMWLSNTKIGKSDCSSFLQLLLVYLSLKKIMGLKLKQKKIFNVS